MRHWAALGLIIVLGLAVQTASAHATLIRSDPPPTAS